MIVSAMQHPDLKRYARSVWAQRVIVALHIDDALPLFFVLPDDVAKNAALFILVPLMGGTEFVLDASRHENRRRDLRVCARPFFSRKGALILENAHVLEARIFL